VNLFLFYIEDCDDPGAIIQMHDEVFLLYNSLLKGKGELRASFIVPFIKCFWIKPVYFFFLLWMKWRNKMGVFGTGLPKSKNWFLKKVEGIHQISSNSYKSIFRERGFSMRRLSMHIGNHSYPLCIGGCRPPLIAPFRAPLLGRKSLCLEWILCIALCIYLLLYDLFWFQFRIFIVEIKTSNFTSILCIFVWDYFWVVVLHRRGGGGSRFDWMIYDVWFGRIMRYSYYSTHF